MNSIKPIQILRLDNWVIYQKYDLRNIWKNEICQNISLLKAYLIKFIKWLLLISSII